MKKMGAPPIVLLSNVVIGRVATTVKDLEGLAFLNFQGLLIVFFKDPTKKVTLWSYTSYSTAPMLLLLLYRTWLYASYCEGIQGLSSS